MVAMTLGWLYEWANCFTLMAELAEATLTTAIIPPESMMSTCGQDYVEFRELVGVARARRRKRKEKKKEKPLTVKAVYGPQVCQKGG